MILVEMVHDVRLIRMNSTHKPSNIRQLLGDSIGHWEGDTLVVDTTNFTNKTRFRGSSENLHVIERFQRVDAGTILYRATIDDCPRSPNSGRSSIHFLPPQVRFTSMRATKATTPCRTS